MIHNTLYSNKVTRKGVFKAKIVLVLDQMSQFCELGAFMLFKGFLSTNLKKRQCCDIKDSPIT